MLLGVDVGGTFTDAVVVTPAGMVHTAKVPSTPEDQAKGVIEAIEAVLERAEAEPGQIRRLAHGMTVATNALLEGKVARTALVASEGMTDVVELGRQARAHLYRLCEAGPRPLAEAGMRFGAPQRMGPEGVVWRALDPEQAGELVEQVAMAEPEAVAVVLLHSYANPEHELMLGELLRKRLPNVQVSLSSELVGTFREYERAASTEVDAALGPLLRGYLERLSSEIRELGSRGPGGLQVMQSSGGLTDASTAAEHAALTVLSGPAGGVGGALVLAKQAGERDVVCLDMGGTSCDVCVIEQGRVAETAERKVAGRPLALPALDIHTVGAGGGSVAWRDAGGALRVGPESAGAEPGPACYGRGGERPTVTDANLLLGRLLDDAPLAGGVALDRAAAERVVAKLAGELHLDAMACAEGIVRVAEAEMSRALRVMTVGRGVDPRGMALMPFGGAGPLHAAALAGEMGIERILCPRASGVLSALGLAAAAPRRDAARTVMLQGEALSAERVRSEREELVRRVRAELAGEGFEGDPPRGSWVGRDVAEVGLQAGERQASDVARVRVVYEMRYRGQSFELAVQESGPIDDRPVDPEALCEAFARKHEERYGYRDEQAEVELVTIRVSAWGEAPALELAAAVGAEPERERETRKVVFEGRDLEAECVRGELGPGTRVAGPAVCALPEATLWVPPGWSGKVDEQGTVRLWR
jgi:N-methylhydantoinase A